MAASRFRRRGGFALPAVLAVTGVVTLVFIVALTALASLNAEAASARQRVRFLQRAMTAEATLAYLAATEPIRPFGISVNDARAVDDFGAPAARRDVSGGVVAPVRLDGRRYLLDVHGPLVVALRDEAGMINLSLLGEPAYSRLMDRLGVPHAQRGALLARHQDYSDTDDLSQPNGAEAREYSDGGPANRRLLRPSEWLSVLGAREATDRRRWRELRDDLAADPASGAFNINTASAAVLGIQFGLTEDQAQAAIRAREAGPLTSLDALAAATGAAIAQDFERVYFYPSGMIVFTLRDTRSAWVYRGRLSITPTGLEQPVWIDQTELSEAPGRAAADTSNATRFPFTPR